MSERRTWENTTHDWARDVDPTHLGRLRRELDSPGTAGGRRHLILEVLAYAQDEAAASGRRGTVTLTYHPDGAVTVSDDGRGTDTRIDEHGSVVRKPVMATPDVRFVDPATSPLLPDGLPRRGMSAVAALSALLVHENHRESGSWSQTYRHGIPDTDLAPSIPRRRPGTVVAFWATVDGPDRTTAADLAAFPDLDVRISEPPGAATPAPR